MDLSGHSKIFQINTISASVRNYVSTNIERLNMFHWNTRTKRIIAQKSYTITKNLQDSLCFDVSEAEISVF